MCMEDYELGRDQLAGQVDITATTTSAPLIAADKYRCAIIFTAPLAGHNTYSLQNPAVLGAGINLGAGDGAVWLNIQDHGELVTREWYVISDQASVKCSVLFSILPKV